MVYSFQLLPLFVMSLCKVPLFVITLVFSGRISLPNFASTYLSYAREGLFIFLSFDIINAIGKTEVRASADKALDIRAGQEYFVLKYICA